MGYKYKEEIPVGHLRCYYGLGCAGATKPEKEFPGYSHTPPTLCTACTHLYRKNNLNRILAKHRAYNSATVEKRKKYAAEKRKTQWAKTMENRSRARAKEKGFPFELTKELIECLYVAHCPILGLELSYGGNREVHKDFSASLDRIDNNLGYVPGNVRIISTKANRLKSDASDLELFKLFMDVARRLISE